MPNQTGTPKPTIEQHLTACGVSRRSFLQLCTALMVTAPVGMALTEKASVLQIAEAIGKAKRPSVIWLHFQDCTGCTETLLRTSHPDVADLILNVISLDYHETLMAASGAQAEAALRSAIEDNAGKFVLVVEGAIPAKDDGVYMQLGGRPSIQVLREVAAKSAAVIAMGSCASWGGFPRPILIPRAQSGSTQLSPESRSSTCPVVRRIPTTCWRWFWNTSPWASCPRWMNTADPSSPTTASFTNCRVALDDAGPRQPSATKAIARMVPLQTGLQRDNARRLRQPTLQRDSGVWPIGVGTPA